VKNVLQKFKTPPTPVITPEAVASPSVNQNRKSDIFGRLDRPRKRSILSESCGADFRSRSPNTPNPNSSKPAAQPASPPVAQPPVPIAVARASTDGVKRSSSASNAILFQRVDSEKNPFKSVLQEFTSSLPTQTEESDSTHKS
jgi:hypothetical protein